MKIFKVISTITLIVTALIIILPLCMMLGGSFMGEDEIIQSIGKIYGLSKAEVHWRIIPQYPTFQAFIELLLDTPQFFVMFWNSCKQALLGVLIQLLVSVPAAWSFARFRFRGKKIIFMIYIILMILPFQVTMVSSYLVLDKFKIMNSHLAIIVPIVFSTFPVFIMERFFKAIPKSIIEAARIDGANELQIFFYVGIPIGLPGIISAGVLSFLEAWNAIEAPLTFLKDKSLWPLSLYLPSISIDNLGLAMVSSVIVMLPAILIFLFGQRYLEKGIVASGIKE
ncbi:carbohydrate ABC transporter permease [Anaerosacchariphilus polymeriproducens]|uniref:Carbohydrate ABC transporter permease n=1 Tax=Anaerosacchariphilus polymeriproducens TaxID=1812858 RepID=A0A371ART1_9FIRM|nr:carbohydrate ABC transporter permease [Anaerosacchariphilus polymeriproducens]RDU22275.1 carbohydrate ABC transporter permease [Anaerosacchariphilus polymeriproducens]